MVRNDNIPSTRANLLHDRNTLESYDGTRFTMGKVDTSPLDLSDSINSRFGISTHSTIDECYDSSQELDPRFSDDSYQMDSSYRNRVGGPPRGIFDDV